MANDRYLLKALPNEDGKRGYRLEIDEFLLDNEMTNLFLVALASLQEDSLRHGEDKKPDWLTYYSLAGIHGEPQEKWNDYSPTEAYGFCHHSMNTFPTWHRPYVLLFESAIYQEMVKQAKSYADSDERKTYLDAAARFRLPYWDLIMPRNDYVETGRPNPQAIWGCPTILKQKKVFVRLPGNNSDVDKGFSEIDNPLFSYKFPKDQDWKQHPERTQLVLPAEYEKTQTVRIPHRNEQGLLEHGDVDLAIQRQAASSAILMWQMLNPDEKGKPIDIANGAEILVNEERSWKSFANNKSHGKDTINEHIYTTVSLESFHDGIHDLIGTAMGRDKDQHPVQRVERDAKDSGFHGHMGDPAYAAFDPIFWLHHNNIERLFCLYQALYPKKYTDVAEGQNQLYPFMKDSKRNCYSSSDDFVKQYQRSGFAIPGDDRLSDKNVDPNVIKQKVKQYLTETYYWPGTLKDWPKKHGGSWALHGKNFKSTKTDVLQMNTFSLKSGTLELVAREVNLSTQKLTVTDEIVPVSEALQLVKAVDSSLPQGAITIPASVSTPPAQVTWNAHVKVRKFAFNGSFSVHLFIGHVKDEQPERYMTKKNEVGFAGVFASRDQAQCPSCQINRENDILVGSVVPLTTILYDYLDDAENSQNLIRDGTMKTIADLNPENVEPFLREHLKWRIIDLGANLLEGQEQQAKLEITVTSRQFVPPTAGSLMGVYGPYTPYPSITSGKPGGYGYQYA